MLMEPTPSTRRSWGSISSSTILRSSKASSMSLENVMNIIGARLDSITSTIGSLASSGRNVLYRSRNLLRSVSAWFMSLPQLNSAVTTLMLGLEVEETFFTFLVEAAAFSRYWVTRFSISSGPAPLSWLKIMIWGKTSLGYRSMPSWDRPKKPTPRIPANTMRKVTRLLTAIRGMFKE